jgi:Protein of unknown function (DUF3761)
VLFRAVLIPAAIITATIGLASPAHSSPGGDCYIAESGDCVPYPRHGGPQPPDATAQCNDGSWSFSEHPPLRQWHMPRARWRAAVLVRDKP